MKRPLDFAADLAARPAVGRSWWRVISTYGPLVWSGVFLFELLNMEAWRAASTDILVAPPAIRALQYALMLPPLLLTCRAAVAIGLGPVLRPVRILAQLVLCLLFSALSRPALVTAAWTLGQREMASTLTESLLKPTPEFFAVWVASAAATALNYAVCLGILVAIKVFRDLEGERVARAEIAREATQARLQALTNQLNPHFLFNVLNTIVSLIETSPRLAQTMVTRFADLLRRILSAGETTFVALAREIELVEQYIEIQEMRFPHRLSHVTAIGPGAAESLVPALVMQPIIENAVLHGLRSDDVRVHITIDARVSGPVLEIRVTNPGRVPPAAEPTVAGGFGLRNVAERLRTLYGAGATVVLDTPSTGVYVAILRMPLLRDVALAREQAA